MPRILDPSLITSLLPEAEIRSRAETLANDIALQGMLTPEGLDSQYSEPVDRGDEACVAYNHKVAALSVVSQYCLVSLMEDSDGRQEFHIAGEVCRLTQAVRDVAMQEEIISLRYFLDITKPLTQIRYTWSLKDQPCMIYPTIDGNSSSRPITRLTDNRLGFVNSVFAHHQLWFRDFTGRILPSFCKQGILKVVSIPFELEGGEIVAGPEPRFYEKADQSAETSDPRPLELASV